MEAKSALFRSPDVSRITGIPSRDLQRLADGPLPPAQPGRRGNGNAALYRFDQLVAALVLRDLRGAGVSAPTLRKVAAALARHGQTLASVRLVIVGRQVLVAESPDELVDVLSRQVVPRALVVSCSTIVAAARSRVAVAEERRKRRSRRQSAA